MTVALTSLRRRLFRAPVVLYHWGFSRLLGHRFVLLIHVGRHPDWLRNIEARPGEEVVIGRDHFVATHRILDLDEAAHVVARYEQRNRFIAPIVRLGLTWLLGTRYNGSDSDRRKLVTRLPLIAFRPQS